jgi:hypothetical protein
VLLELELMLVMEVAMVAPGVMLPKQSTDKKQAARDPIRPLLRRSMPYTVRERIRWINSQSLNTP